MEVIYAIDITIIIVIKISMEQVVPPRNNRIN